MIRTTTGHPCNIRDCPQIAYTQVTFGEFSGLAAMLCDRHKPTVEQALRRGVVVKLWTIDGYYPSEIAFYLGSMTGHTIRESTVLADLKWLGLTEANRAAKARLDLAVSLGEAGPNVVALRQVRRGTLGA